MKHRFQRYIVRTEINIVNFSHTSRIHSSAKIRHSAHSYEWTECAQTHTDRHTKVKTVYPPVSLHSLGGYNT